MLEGPLVEMGARHLWIFPCLQGGVKGEIHHSYVQGSTILTEPHRGNLPGNAAWIGNGAQTHTLRGLEAGSAWISTSLDIEILRNGFLLT